MKILMVNKFLHPNGGSETYVFKLGKFLEEHGHKVQYFGMDHDNRCVGNAVNAYTPDMDFHNAPLFSKLSYSIKTIYSKEAKNKIRLVLDDFKPDVVHLNNFTYQLTPSIILEIVKWRKENHKKCKIVFTAHDANLVCPNHLLRNPNTNQNCKKCLGGHFYNCAKWNCIHGSKLKSLIGAIEAYFWNFIGIYKYIDTVICCSRFMKSVYDTNPIFKDKTVALHNFVDAKCDSATLDKQEFVLYFGRFSKEKGVETLIKACKNLPEIKFVFAGTGPLEDELNGNKNIENVGFKTGKELGNLISHAQFSIYPSEWYENCPFSVIESKVYGTPVIGANIGGIPELIKDGFDGKLFESGDLEDLTSTIKDLWNNKTRIKEYSDNCLNENFIDLAAYTQQLLKIYCNE